MQVIIPGYKPDQIGGGWRAMENLVKGFQKIGVGVDLQQRGDCTVHQGDVVLWMGATIEDPKVFDLYKNAGIPIVLRVDGVTEDNRNEGRGTSRLLSMAKRADAVVYQSKFSKETTGALIDRPDGVVVYNGVDLDVFTPEGEKVPGLESPVIGHVMWRKDANKRYEEVVEMWRRYSKEIGGTLLLVGRYPTEWEKYNFGFFKKERIAHINPGNDVRLLTACYRTMHALFYPSFADPAPNVVLEAMACGTQVFYTWYGGTIEYVVMHQCGTTLTCGGQEYNLSQFLEDYDFYRRFKTDRELTRKRAEQFTLERMAHGYKQVMEGVVQ